MNLLVSRKRLLRKRIKGFPRDYGGYLIITSLCNLLKVKLGNSNARNFVLNCMDNLEEQLANCLYNAASSVHYYYFSISNEIISAFIVFLNKFSSAYSLEKFIGAISEYESEYGTGKATDIIITNRTNLNLDWKNNEDIYIPDGTLANLSEFALIIKCLYYNSQQLVEMQFGNVNDNAIPTGSYEIREDSIYINTLNGSVLLLSAGGIDYSKYATLVSWFSKSAGVRGGTRGVVLGLSSSSLDFNGWVKYVANYYGSGGGLSLEVPLSSVSPNLYIQLSYYCTEGNVYEIYLLMNK